MSAGTETDGADLPNRSQRLRQRIATAAVGLGGMVLGAHVGRGSGVGACRRRQLLGVLQAGKTENRWQGRIRHRLWLTRPRVPALQA